MKNNKKVSITKNGPYCVSGNIPLAKQISTVGKSGEPEEWKEGEKYPQEESYSLCRCGISKNKPFCDGAHLKNNFDGKETASRKEYAKQAGEMSGPGVDLTDAEALCSLGRFCHLAGGTWNNVEKSGDPKCKKNAIQSACNCPSGRLVVWDKKTKKPIENKFEQSIGIVEDPQAGVSGPVWLRGGIELESADGKKYEKRNRVTLCRCGQSKNKPFCDGSHISCGFNDGDKSLK